MESKEPHKILNECVFDKTIHRYPVDAQVTAEVAEESMKRFGIQEVESFRTRATEELEGMMLKSQDYFNPQNVLLRSAIEKIKNLK